MRNFFLLVLTFAGITGSRQDKNMEYMKHTLLKEAIFNLNKTLNHNSNNLNQFVKNIHQDATLCSGKTLCQTAMVLVNTNLDDSLLQRQLFSYAALTGHHNCNVSGSDEIKLKELLQHTKRCCQNLLRNSAMKTKANM